MIVECNGLKWRYAVVVADPHLHGVVDGETLCSSPYGELVRTDNGLIAKTFTGPYLLETLYFLKSNGIRMVSVVDTATSIVGRLAIGSPLPIYTSIFFPEIRFDYRPPTVPDFELLQKAIDKLSLSQHSYTEVIAATSFLPLTDLMQHLEKLKLMEIDVIDRSSAYVYSICKGKMRCIVVDIIDSNLSKGIDRSSVHVKSGKYYDLLLQSAKESVEVLLELGGENS